MQIQNTNFGATMITIKNAPKLPANYYGSADELLLNMKNHSFRNTSTGQNFQMINRIARDFNQTIKPGTLEGESCYLAPTNAGSKTEKSLINKLGKFFDKKGLNLEAKSLPENLANKAYN
ncbi:MAG: hypothetical protein WCF95_06685 [bacterium]